MCFFVLYLNPVCQVHAQDTGLYTETGICEDLDRVKVLLLKIASEAISQKHLDVFP